MMLISFSDPGENGGKRLFPPKVKNVIPVPERCQERFFCFFDFAAIKLKK
jgi:hypothetical protein